MKENMQIYLSRNNQQAGPFEEAKVLEMLRGGQVSSNDFGIRQGDRQWRTLSEMFRDFAPPPVNSSVQNIVAWASKNLPNQLFVQHKSVIAELKSYLITLTIVGVLPFLAGFVLNLFIPLGKLLMLLGGILFVVMTLMFALIFLVNHFRKKKFVAIFNSQGVVTNGNVLYEWDKLQYINFLKIKNPRLHGQGLIPMLIAKLAVFLIRSVIFKDPRQRSLDGAELIFANGKVILPTTMTNFAEIWDFIEKVPAQPRFDERFDQNTLAELRNCGLYNKPQNSTAVGSNPQLPTAQINQPTVAQKSNGVWIMAGALIGGLMLVGVGGILAAYLFIYNLSAVKAVSNNNRNGNSNSSPTVNNGVQTFSDSSPDKKPDFTMTAEEFFLDADDYTKEKQSLAKYKGKIVLISGWVYLFKEFDGKNLYFRTSGSFLDTELIASEASKLANIKEGERVKVKCDVVDDAGMDLKNCAVLERKPAVIANEKADISITAKEYWDQVANINLSYETKQKNRAKYFGKILEISGKVKKISGDGYFLAIKDSEWVTCYPDDENKPLFAKLTEGQEVKFKGVDDGNTLKYCVVSR